MAIAQKRVVPELKSATVQLESTTSARLSLYCKHVLNGQTRSAAVTALVDYGLAEDPDMKAFEEREDYPRLLEREIREQGKPAGRGKVKAITSGEKRAAG